MKKLLSLILIITLSVTMTLTFPAVQHVHAASGEKYSVNISGTFNYASGQEMIDYINVERAKVGSANLELDSQLTDAAMQRAAELAYFFDHTRPDGTSCFTVSSRACGENIAAGQISPTAAFNSWMNSDGHRENMMDSSYTKVGIGHVEHNGINLWVQLFGKDSANYPETRTAAESDTATIMILEGSTPIELNQGSVSKEKPISLTSGETYALSLGVVNAGWKYCYCNIDGDSFNWVSTNEAVAEVSSDGIITGKGIGDAVIKAEAKSGSISDLYLNIHVGIDIGKTTVYDIQPIVYTGREITPTVTIYDGDVLLTENKDYTVTYRDNIDVGTGYAEITGLGNYGGTVSKAFIIEPIDVTNSAEITLDSWDMTGYNHPINFLNDNVVIVYKDTLLTRGSDYYVASTSKMNGVLHNFTIEYIGIYSGRTTIYNLESKSIAAIADQEYTGKAITPSVNVSGLTEGVDFVAAYSDNINLGTGTVTVSGIGKYRGTLTATFNIVPKSVKNKNVTLSQSVYTYDGTAKTPTVFIEGLTENKDFTVSYANNISVGTATVTITGMGEYSGSIQKTFTINPKKMTGVTVSSVTVNYDGKPHTISVKGAPAGAEVTYSTSENGTYSKTAPKRTDAGSLTIYYRITKENYQTITGSATVKIKPVPLPSTAELYVEEAVYTGEPIYNFVTIDGLTGGTDYTVFFSDNVDVGEAKVEVRGEGNYTGTINLSFLILPKAPAKATAVLTGHDDVKFSWSKSEGASGYRVYYKKSTSSKWTSLGTTTKLYMKKSNLSDGVKYQFKVVPYYKDADGTKRFSDNQYKTASVTTLKKVTLSTFSRSSGKVKVKWNDISGESGYQISRSSKKTGTYIVYKSIKSNTTSKLVSATKGKTYWYKVRAYKTVNGEKIYGPWSEPKKYIR